MLESIFLLCMKQLMCNLNNKHIILKANVYKPDFQYVIPGISMVSLLDFLWKLGFDINIKDFDAWKRIEGVLSAWNGFYNCHEPQISIKTELYKKPVLLEFEEINSK